MHLMHFIKCNQEMNLLKLCFHNWEYRNAVLSTFWETTYLDSIIYRTCIFKFEFSRYWCVRLLINKRALFLSAGNGNVGRLALTWSLKFVSHDIRATETTVVDKVQITRCEFTACFASCPCYPEFKLQFTSTIIVLPVTWSAICLTSTTAT